MGAEVNPYPKEEFTMNRQIKITKATTIQDLIKQLFKKVKINIIKIVIQVFDVLYVKVHQRKYIKYLISSELLTVKNSRIIIYKKY